MFVPIWACVTLVAVITVLFVAALIGDHLYRAAVREARRLRSRAEAAEERNQTLRHRLTDEEFFVGYKVAALEKRLASFTERPRGTGGRFVKRAILTPTTD